MAYVRKHFKNDEITGQSSWEEPVDSMIKRFNQQVKREGIIFEVRRREFYISPSEKRRKKHEDHLRAEKALKDKRF